MRDLAPRPPRNRFVPDVRSCSPPFEAFPSLDSPEIRAEQECSGAVSSTLPAARLGLRRAFLGGAAAIACSLRLSVTARTTCPHV